MYVCLCTRVYVYVCAFYLVGALLRSVPNICHLIKGASGVSARPALRCQCSVVTKKDASGIVR